MTELLPATFVEFSVDFPSNSRDCHCHGVTYAQFSNYTDILKIQFLILAEANRYLNTMKIPSTSFMNTTRITPHFQSVPSPVLKTTHQTLLEVKYLLPSSFHEPRSEVENLRTSVGHGDRVADCESDAQIIQEVEIHAWSNVQIDKVSFLLFKICQLVYTVNLLRE